jgi:hypothetical protein
MRAADLGLMPEVGAQLGRVLRFPKVYDQWVICPLQSGPFVNLDWTLKETEHGQEARA